MIGQLRGRITERTLDGYAIIDVGGVGYEVSLPLRAWDELPAEDATAVLHIHTHVREDTLALYGFSSKDDRAAFRALLSVSKIGPKVALAILGRLSANDLAHAIAAGDKDVFKRIPGVGAKTAERLLIDLKDKLHPSTPVRTSTTSPEAPPASTGSPGNYGSLPTELAAVAAALVTMGYKRSEAERAAERLVDSAEGKAPEELLREALLSLG